MIHVPTTALRDLIKIEKGKKAPESFVVPTNTSSRYLQIEDLRPDATTKYCEPFNCPRATKADAVIAWDGANAGTTSCNLEGYIGSTLAVLRPNEPRTLHAPFLSRFLQHKFDYLQKTATGATIPHLSRDALTALQIPVPPLVEQVRTVRQLDEADDLRRLRARADRRSVNLIPALFQQLFGDPATNPRGWPRRKLRELCEKFSDGPFGSNLKSSHYTQSGVRVIRLQNIGVGRLIDKDKAYISPEHFDQLRRHECLPGDVLVGTLGDPNLRACVLPPGIHRALNKADCGQIRPRRELATVEFICWLLNLPSTLAMGSGLVHGQTRGKSKHGPTRRAICSSSTLGAANGVCKPSNRSPRTRI